MTTKTQHAYEMGRIAYDNGRAFSPHHYLGDEAQAYDHGTLDAINEAREALRVHGVRLP